MSTSSHCELKTPDEFLHFLSYGNPTARIKSLHLNGVNFNDEDFHFMLSLKYPLLALQNVTSLKIENVRGLPRVVLASCITLLELEIRDVDFRNDLSSTSYIRPMLKTLTCGRLPDKTLQTLLSTVDASALESLECGLMYAEFDPGRMGCQRVIDICWFTLKSLTLNSPSSFQPASTDMNQLFMDVCDLSANLRLKRLVFTTTYHPYCDEIDSASRRMHVLAQILSTISTKICWLDSLEYKIRIPIDHQLQKHPSNSMLRFEGCEPLDFFKQYGWHSLDQAMVQVATAGRRMDALVEVTGTMTEGTFKLFDRDSFALGSLKLKRVMEGWKKQMFVGVRKQKNIHFRVEAHIDQ